MSAGRNQTGGQMLDGEAEWVAFDALPRPVRRVLDQAKHKYAPTDIRSIWGTNTKRDPEAFATWLADALDHRATDLTARTYGLHHPEAR